MRQSTAAPAVSTRVAESEDDVSHEQVVHFRDTVGDIPEDLENWKTGQGTGRSKKTRMSLFTLGVFHEEDIPSTFGAKVSAAGNRHVFADSEAMKAKVRKAICAPKYNVFDYYHEDGIWQFIAKRKWFEYITLSVISLNALWIAIDTDHNKSDSLASSHPIFQVAEHCFCVFFVSEWFVRFMAFKLKRYGLRDSWFVFDSTLMLLMVFETWVVGVIMLGGEASSGDQGGVGDASILRLLRLLRLTRMARITRILRAVPELMILIKAMVAATRSVFFTLCLLMVIIYVFAIAFTQLTRGSIAGEDYFDTVPDSMLTLTVYGTLLDEIGRVACDVGRENKFAGAIFFFFILLAALTVMNMLIGVLCEVVNVTASVEKEQLMVTYVNSQLREMMHTTGIDSDYDNRISRQEFERMLENTEAARALQEVGVDVVGLVDFTDFIFTREGDHYMPDDEQADDNLVSLDEGLGDEIDLSFEEFMDVVLQLRGTNQATVKDVVDLRKSMTKQLNRMERRISNGYKRQAREELRAQKKNQSAEKDSVWASAPSSEKGRQSAGSVSMPGSVPMTDSTSGGTAASPRVGQSRQEKRQKLLMLEEALSAGMGEIQVLRQRSGRLEEALKTGLNELRMALFEDPHGAS
eukprot:gnl/TRDRNA2_/TRDRNA2_190804_c0_seq1.p1 gnl/TRDRNA2_/TRDRNA2_190804_c0~~gnl/TRDRNA2_/TRDRNA2_190804_c0_seq1.p1  ORF type:complete len:635 (-),score=130.03 gnl/TRDRNA2_/TRDRNA2_190804_c0_seq1:43-1947(-)